MCPVGTFLMSISFKWLPGFLPGNNKGMVPAESDKGMVPTKNHCNKGMVSAENK